FAAFFHGNDLYFSRGVARYTFLQLLIFDVLSSCHWFSRETTFFSTWRSMSSWTSDPKCFDTGMATGRGILLFYLRSHKTGLKESLCSATHGVLIESGTRVRPVAYRAIFVAP